MRPLVTLLPPLRLNWAAYARPSAIFTDPALQKLRETWAGAERRAAFHRATGIDLEKVPETWIVAYEIGTLYLLSKAGAERAQQAFMESSQFLVKRPAGHSSLHAWDGSFEDIPRSLIVGSYFVAFADRDPTLRRVVLERALGRLDHVPAIEPLRELGAAFEHGPKTLASIRWLGSLATESPSVSPTSSLGDSLLSIQADITTDAGFIGVSLELTGALGGEESADDEVNAWAAAARRRPELSSLGLDGFEHDPASCAVVDELDVCQLLVRIDAKTLNQSLIRLLASELSAY